MKRICVALNFLLVTLSCSANEVVQLKVYDCGPLARGELGVVFSTGEYGSGQTYFSKGKATVVCSKLVNAEKVSGYESNYCEKYKPENPHECKHIKIFEILKYHGP